MKNFFIVVIGQKRQSDVSVRQRSGTNRSKSKSAIDIETEFDTMSG